MIHIYDGTLLANDARGAAAERKIDQAYRAHTSTSPSATILSSLDLARRQVELEGTYLTLQCAARGRELRESIQHLNTNHGDAGIRVIEAGDLLSSVAKDISHSDLDRGTAIPDFALDPSRVTVAFPEGVTGSIVKKKLFSEYNIQINKYSHSTILLNMTIGMTYGNVWTVAQSLWQIGRESLRSAALAKSQGIEETRRAMMPPPFSGFHSPSRKVDSELAFYANNEDKLAVRLVPLHSCATSKGLVCADFVTPYPPGYPVLVPGQKITRESVEFLVMMGIDEIHGTRRTTSGALYVPIFEV
jgi:arginine decarboxylase